MAFTQTYDGDEPVRINKWLGQTGICSRREAEGLIGQGLVRIDGEVVTDAGRKIERGQTLTLSDAAEAELAAGVTIVIHKPVGYVSGQPEPGKIPAVRLLTGANRVGAGQPPAKDASLPPIGGLDEDSSPRRSSGRSLIWTRNIWSPSGARSPNASSACCAMGWNWTTAS